MQKFATKRKFAAITVLLILISASAFVYQKYKTHYSQVLSVQTTQNINNETRCRRTFVAKEIIPRDTQAYLSSLGWGEFIHWGNKDFPSYSDIPDAEALGLGPTDMIVIPKTLGTNQILTSGWQEYSISNWNEAFGDSGVAKLKKAIERGVNVVFLNRMPGGMSPENNNGINSLYKELGLHFKIDTSVPYANFGTQDRLLSESELASSGYLYKTINNKVGAFTRQSATYISTQGPNDKLYVKSVFKNSDGQHTFVEEMIGKSIVRAQGSILNLSLNKSKNYTKYPDEYHDFVVDLFKCTPNEGQLISDPTIVITPTPDNICVMGHSVKISHGVNGQAGAAANKINIDAVIEGGNTIETNTERFIASPIQDWRTSSNALMSGGSDMRSSVRGDSLSFTTASKDIKLLYSKGAAHATVDVVVDGVKVKSFDEYSPANMYKEVIDIPMPTNPGKTLVCDPDRFRVKNLQADANPDTRRPELNWEALPGAASYIVEVSPSNGATWAVGIPGKITKSTTNNSVETVFWEPTNDLLTADISTIQIRVYAIHTKFGRSGYSNIVDVTLPKAPSRVSGMQVVPDPGKGGNAPYLLRWSKPTPNINQATANSYQVQIATDQNFENIVRDTKNYQPISFYNVNNVISYPAEQRLQAPAEIVPPSRTLYWRVRSANISSGQTSFSNWVVGPAFKSKLSIVRPVSPTNGETISSLKPNLVMDRDLLGYVGVNLQIEVARYVPGQTASWTPIQIENSTLVINPTSIRISLTPKGNLPKNQEFIWRVIATNPEYGRSDSSTMYLSRFRTPAQ